jgi:hypothetical protein
VRSAVVNVGNGLVNFIAHRCINSYSLTIKPKLGSSSSARRALSLLSVICRRFIHHGFVRRIASISRGAEHDRERTSLEPWTQKQQRRLEQILSEQMGQTLERKPFMSRYVSWCNRSVCVWIMMKLKYTVVITSVLAYAMTCWSWDRQHRQRTKRKGHTAIFVFNAKILLRDSSCGEKVPAILSSRRFLRTFYLQQNRMSSILC